MYEQSNEIGEIAKALLEVQRSLPIAAKDAVNPFVKNRYASLNSIMEACHGPLNANGVVVLQCPVPVAEQGSLGLMTRLIHAESGQWISGITVIPMAKSDPQGMGAAITYARRYALSAMLGIVAGDDGDCDEGARNAAPARTSQQISNRTPNSGGSARETAKPQKQQDMPWNDPYYEDDPFTVGQKASEPPKLPGINYSFRDGQVIASGDTVKNKEALKAAGFKWNPGDKVWFRGTPSETTRKGQVSVRNQEEMTYATL